MTDAQPGLDLGGAVAPRTSRTPRRTAEDRLAAIPAVMDPRDAFMARVAAAEETGNLLALADLMAEAIGMERAARGHEVVGRDGRVMVCIEGIAAAHCARAAEEAYRRVRGRANG